MVNYESNHVLVQGAQMGDPEALDILFTKYRPLLLQYLEKRVGDKELAEELTQETFLRALTSLRNTNQELNFSAWIYTIARNASIDYWRRAGRTPSQIPINEELLMSFHSHRQYADICETKHIKQVVKEVLNQLSVRQRTAIVLRDMEGYSYKKAAELMDLSEAAFTSLLNRARINFVKEIVPYLHPKAMELEFGYQECLFLLQKFSILDWPEDIDLDLALQARSYFDEVAVAFDIARQEAYPDDLDTFLLSKTDGSSEMVAADFGTGAGHLAARLAGKFGLVHAVDISPNMLACTKKRLNTEGIRNVVPTLGNICKLLYANSSIDVGFCSVVMHHVFDPGAVIKEMVRTIKPGGQLLVADIVHHQIAYLHRDQRDFWAGFKEKQLADWLKEANLTDIWVEKPAGIDFRIFKENGDAVTVPLIIARGRKKGDIP